MNAMELMRERYSCKKYSEKPVEEEKLTAVLEAGRIAPTARNAQPQKVYVIRSAEAIAKIDAATRCRYGAPIVLAVAYDRDQIFTYPGGKYDSGAEDCAIAATQMMLAAKDAGLDTCWLNLFDPDELKKSLDLPENETLVLLLDLGYAAEGAAPLPNHTKKKALSETVKYL